MTSTSTALRLATAVFLLALFVHGADHLRRGMDVISTTVMVAGMVQTVLALVTVWMVFSRHRLAPYAAMAIGFASAVGFTVVHLLPDWFGPFSDSFINAPAANRVNGFSWFAALFEIAADLAIGITGARGLQAAQLSRSAA